MKRLLSVSQAFALVAAVLAACDAGAAEEPKPKAKDTGSAPRSASPSLRLRLYSIEDPGIGCTAVTLLVPTDWKVEGGVRWQMEYSNLATGAFRVFDPKSRAALECFPVTPCTWDSNGITFFAPGSIYLGNEVREPPRDVEQYVRHLFVPRFRAGAKGLKIGAHTPLPAVAELVAKNAQEPGVTKDFRSGKVRLEWDDKGTPVAEDVFVTITYMRSPMMPTATIWWLEHQYSLRAEKEKADAIAPLLQTIAASAKIDLRWYAGYSQVLDMYRQGQLASIKSAGELSRSISRANDAMLASMRSSWQERQASQDRIYRGYSESIRGVETFSNTFESREVELPSGYDSVWANSSGEYVFSNVGGYDPNVGSTLEWRRLERAP